MVICPAFQSTYILDDSVRAAHFSYVWQLDEETRAQFLASNQTITPESDILTDSSNISITSNYGSGSSKVDYYAFAEKNSVVPWRDVKKTKYGIVKKTFYPIKNYRLKTAPMENVLTPPEVQSLNDNLFDTLDSFYNPLLAEQSQSYYYGYDPTDDFNVDQEYYNKYYGELFIDDRARESITEELLTDQDSSEADTVENKPFFKGLFKKKQKDKLLSDEALPELIEQQSDTTQIGN